MRTRAQKVQGGYVLSGTKMWITNSPIADVFVVWAKSDAHGGKIRGFVLEKGMKGLSAPEDQGEAIASRLDHRRDRDGRASKSARMRCCPMSRVSRARSAASTARATASPGVRWARPRPATSAARQYTLDRKQFGRPLAANQLVQLKLANMATEITLGLQAALRVGRRLEARANWSPRRSA